MLGVGGEYTWEDNNEGRVTGHCFLRYSIHISRQSDSAFDKAK